MKESETLSPACLELAQKVGLFIEYWGFKEVHGRIWTIIFLSKDPVDANFIKNNLNISKALTSMSLNDLMGYEVIREVKKTAPGTQKYEINPDITGVILDVLANRESKMLTKVIDDFKNLEAAKDSPNNSSISHERLESLGDMINSANSFLKSLLTLSKVDFKDFESVMNVES